MKIQWVYKIPSAVLIVMLAVVALPVTPARAASIVVTSNADNTTTNGQCTLREAITNANVDGGGGTSADCASGAGADVITFNAGMTITLASPLPAIADPDGLTINGGGTVTVSGNGAVRVFSITAGTATIQNLTLTNGQVNGNGGAIFNNGGTGLTISGVTFNNNRTVTGAGNDGGAIYHTSGALSISNSTFTSNYAQDNGGAAYIANGTGTMSISGSTFNTQNNAAIDDGAAIYLNNGTLSITTTTFTSNRTTNGNGGGIYQNGGTLTVTGATFSGNTASVGDGGAINVSGGTLTINNTAFTNSTAANSAENGGAVYHDSATLLTVTNSTFTGNTSTNGDGGAIMLDSVDSSASISGSTFTSNTAEDDAGAIYNDGEPFTVTTSTFTSNSAGTGAGGPVDGGAIRISGFSTSATSSIRLSTFTNNSITMAANQTLHGGAITNDGTIIIANVTFSGNSLTKSAAGTGNSWGGAIYSGGTTTIHNATLSGNTISESGTGTGSGGAIYSAGGGVTIANSIVAGGMENGVAGNCGGTITNGGNNIDYLGGDCGFALTTNPNLGSLTGTPQYFPLNAASSAIDAGSNAICATAASTNNASQNGLTRPLDGNGDTVLTCDIGSYEAPTALIATTTTITADTPEPSVVGETVAVTVTVSGGATPTGTVDITGADTNCSITLAGGTGSCNVTFTSVGNKTLTATYNPDATHAASNDTEAHTVNQATSSVTVTCPVAPQPYTGLAQTPCTASYLTSDGLTGSSNPLYSNNTNVGTATADATYDGDANHAGSSNSATFAISQATSTVTVTCPVAAQPYTGLAQAPCTAEATGAGMSPVDVTASLVYLNNTNVGAVTADASWAGDANHTGDTGSGSFTISQSTSTVTVTCPASVSFTGAVLTPCTAEATGVGMSPVDVTASLVYLNNTNVGAATADASWAGDANHTGNTGSGGFTISQAASIVTVTCPASVTFTGSAQTPCTAEATGAGMSPVDVSASLTYLNNTNVGAATAEASWGGDANHTGDTGSGGFAISPAASTVTVTCPASVDFTGSAQTPCTAEATGAGMGPVDVSASLVYSNNTNAGVATADASWAGDANHTGDNGSGSFTIGQITSTVTVTCPVAAQPYTGSAQTPCTAEATGVGMSPVDVTASLVYSNNINVGAATANATFAGDANHTSSNGSGGFTIGQVSSTVTVTCPATVQPFTGSAQTPCTAEATGVGMSPVDVTASLVYSNNINLGVATADASWAGDANHTGNTGSGNFTIGQATSTVTVTCPVSVSFTGSAQTPCSAEATGAGMSPVDVSASLVYSNNVNVGAATADASWAGDANHTGDNGSGGFTIGQASQTINVISNTPPASSNGSSFDVEAIATSGLPVTITTSGVCTGGDTDGTATITMTSGTGTCSIFYNQAGDANYSAAPQVQQDVTATEGPAFTSADNTTFDVGFAGSFNITAVGNPSTMTITSAGALPSGVTIVDNGDGTALLGGTPAVGTNGTYSLILTADNGVSPNGTQNFTLTVKNGPVIGANGVNSVPDTGNGSVSENESIIDTLGITQLTVAFSQDVYDPAGDTDVKDVTNPANYLLVRSTAGVFATVSCAGGPVAPDVTISVDSVTYNDGTPSGTGPFVSTLSINGGFPLNVVGFYRLYVCGTTSIVDANNTSLILAGNGTTPGTDFQRNFRISTQATGGGGGGGGNNANAQTLVTSSFLIPVTGFAPDQVTTLPVQPADKAYTSLGQMTIEIPTLGIKFPIVGASLSNKTWDLTWLQNSVAYLEGSAYPTLAGNTVLTAHVQDANKNLGPFSDIKGMQVGQNIYIHVNGQTYVYQVQESRKILPGNINAMFKHEEDSWITLVTCEDFNAKTALYITRRMVRAVLISVIPSKK